jgi:hypothetical protein
MKKPVPAGELTRNLGLLAILHTGPEIGLSLGQTYARGVKTVDLGLFPPDSGKSQYLTRNTWQIQGVLHEGF